MHCKDSNKIPKIEKNIHSIGQKDLFCLAQNMRDAILHCEPFPVLLGLTEEAAG